MENLPASNDSFWEGSEVNTSKPIPIELCAVHTRKDWMKGEDYTQDARGIVCRKCGWGTQVPGFYRVLDGKVIDLRSNRGQ